MSRRNVRGQPLSNLLRVREAADELDVSERRIRQLIASKVIDAAEVTPRLYLVSRQSVELYKVNRRPPGRPKGAR